MQESKDVHKGGKRKTDYRLGTIVLRPLIYRFDEFLCRCYGVYEFSDDKDCILRLQQATAAHTLTLPGCVIEVGAPVIEIHLSNERMPKIPEEGANMAWAAHAQRLFFHSLRLAAGHIKSSNELAKAQALGGVTAIFPPYQDDSGARFIEQAGFTIMPYYRPLGVFGEFWENFYSWVLIWTYNPASLKRLNLMRLRRSEFWMPMVEFLRRYCRKNLQAINSPAAGRGSY